MADDQRPAPTLTDKARRDAEAKRDRQAAALRENLKRRKAQARARDDGGEDEQDTQKPQASGD